MPVYVELWTAKTAWLDLSKEERGNYMAQLAPALQQLTASGVEILSWGLNDAATFNRAGYDFFAVWKFPDAASAQGFEKLVEGAGWYNYFEQVNISGEVKTPHEVIVEMIAL